MSGNLLHATLASGAGNVLITGGFGYLGGRLAQHLSASLPSASIVLGSRRRRSSPSWLPSARVVETDWSSYSTLLDACAGIDTVVHLAGMNAADCAADPVAALDANGMATANLLRAAIASNVRRFIYVSTAHVYGSPLIGSISEQNCAAAIHPYATSHRAGEDAVLFAHQQNRIQGVVIRLSNAFGPPTHPDVNCWMLLVNDLCRQAVKSRELVLRTAGLQRRDFITLTDACRAIEHLMALAPESLDGQPYNVGGAWAPTVLEMAEHIARCCNQTFGYLPPISRPGPTAHDRCEALEYRIDKLTKTGFTLLSNRDPEIIGTLRFCARPRT